MKLLSRFQNSEEVEEEDENLEDEYPKQKTEVVEVEKEKEYTEHTAEVRYPNGDTEEIKFDKLSNHNNGLVLYNYKGVYVGRGTSFDSEKIATLPHSGYSKFHTVNREKKALEYTVEETRSYYVNEEGDRVTEDGEPIEEGEDEE